MYIELLTEPLKECFADKRIIIKQINEEPITIQAHN